MGSSNTTDLSKNDDDMDALSDSSSSDLEITKILKPDKNDKMGIDEDDEDEDDEDDKSKQERPQDTLKKAPPKQANTQDSDEDDDQDMLRTTWEVDLTAGGVC